MAGDETLSSRVRPHERPIKTLFIGFIHSAASVSTSISIVFVTTLTPQTACHLRGSGARTLSGRTRGTGIPEMGG
jgi:hypothetical protein